MEKAWTSCLEECKLFKQFRSPWKMLLQNMPKIQELKKNTIVEARDIKNVI